MLKYIVQSFKNEQFEYLESFYSVALWRPILVTLFRPGFTIVTEYLLSRIEAEYPNLRADFVVLVKDFAPPTVFVELARDHLINVSVNHKDEDKSAFMMGSSLFRLMWLNRHRGQEFLKKLRVFGILGGGSDFDLCMMYAVFPSADNDQDFYFVFDSSKTRLRFKLLEYNSFADDQCYSASNDFEFHAEPLFKYELSTSTVAEEDISAELVNLINDSLVMEEFDPEEPQDAMPPGLNQRYCESIKKEGQINNTGPQILEKLADLVHMQADLLIDMEDDRTPTDRRYRYEASRIDLMLQSRKTYSRPSPKRRRMAQSEAAFIVTMTPNKQIKQNIASILETITLAPKKHYLDDKENFKPDDKENPPDSASGPGDKDVVSSDVGTTVCIKKAASRYELEIYQNEVIKNSACFPKCFGHNGVPGDGNKIELKLEQIISGYTIYDYKMLRNSKSFSTKILVDLFGALVTLHSAGYVHGDISPGNVGYNESKGIWQLFDFDNSRPIEEAAEGIGKYNVTQKFANPKYLETGCYFPFDDFFGLKKTLYYPFWRVPFDLRTQELVEILSKFDDENKFFDVPQLQKIYFKTVKILWNQIKDPSDPSIKNAAKILKIML